MSNAIPPATPVDTSLTTSQAASQVNYSRCHEGILAQLDTLIELPALLEPAARARRIAEDALHFFSKAVFDHHADEEKELFPAVLAAAREGAERDNVRRLIDELTRGHRNIEALWRRIAPQLESAAYGQPSRFDAAALGQLAREYARHARLEEDEFLPLSQAVLTRRSPTLAELGLALHMRHVLRDCRRGLRGS